MSVDRVLQKISEKENSQLPRLIDPETRLDNVTAGPGHRITYHYTILHALGADGNIAKLNGLPATERKDQMCGDKQVQLFFKSGVTVSYQYRTQDGSEEGKIAVAPSDCNSDKPSANLEPKK
jgi:hypothetical protein